MFHQQISFSLLRISVSVPGCIRVASCHVRSTADKTFLSRAQNPPALVFVLRMCLSPRKALPASSPQIHAPQVFSLTERLLTALVPKLIAPALDGPPPLP